MKKSVLFASIVFLVVALGCNFSVNSGSPAPVTSVPPTTASPTLPSVPATDAAPTLPAAPASTSAPTLPAPPLPISPTAVPAATGVQFILTASAANISSNWVNIDSPLTNNNPNAIVFASSNWNPGGGGGTYNDHEIGVWYNSSAQKWAVYNQDRADMPVGAAFNVLVVPASASVFTVTASASNTAGNYTFIDSPLTNNNPNAIVFITANYNPGDLGNIYNDHATGVWYDTAVGKWSIYNQDLVDMPVGAAFNVLVSSVSSSVFIVTATASNISGDYVFIDGALTNNNPNALVLITSNWNPGGGSGTYNDHATGVWYESNSGKWAVYNQDKATMPAGPAFNIMVLSPLR
jgi:hypothetical protein